MPDKISRELRDRLAGLKAGEMMTVIIMFDIRSLAQWIGHFSREQKIRIVKQFCQPFVKRVEEMLFKNEYIWTE